MTRSGWTRLSPRGAMTCYGQFHHEASGWGVAHCGHPTANWPYYAVNPDGKIIVAPNGHGFQKLEFAMKAVEQIWQAPRLLPGGRGTWMVAPGQLKDVGAYR